MTIEQAIYAALNNVTALSGRISPSKAVQLSMLPYVTYQQVSGGQDYTHDGPVELSESSYQFDCWGRDYDEVRDIARQVRNALHAGEDPAHGFYCFIDLEMDDYEPDTYIYRHMVQARVWFSN